MQLAATGHERNIPHLHCHVEGNMLLVHLNGDNRIQNFHFGRYILGYILKPISNQSLFKLIISGKTLIKLKGIFAYICAF